MKKSILFFPILILFVLPFISSTYFPHCSIIKDESTYIGNGSLEEYLGVGGSYIQGSGGSSGYWTNSNGFKIPLIKKVLEITSTKEKLLFEDGTTNDLGYYVKVINKSLASFALDEAYGGLPFENVCYNMGVMDSIKFNDTHIMIIKRVDEGLVAVTFEEIEYHSKFISSNDNIERKLDKDCYGCFDYFNSLLPEIEGYCYPVGFRHNGKFCGRHETSVEDYLPSINFGFGDLKIESDICTYDFECINNNCYEGLCEKRTQNGFFNESFFIESESSLTFFDEDFEYMVTTKDVEGEIEVIVDGSKIEKDFPYGISENLVLENLIEFENKSLILYFSNLGDKRSCQGIFMNGVCYEKDDVIKINQTEELFIKDVSYTITPETINNGQWSNVKINNESSYNLWQNSVFTYNDQFRFNLVNKDEKEFLEFKIMPLPKALCDGFYLDDICREEGEIFEFYGRKYKVLNEKMVEFEELKEEKIEEKTNNSLNEEKVFLENNNAPEFKEEVERDGIFSKIVLFFKKIF